MGEKLTNINWEDVAESQLIPLGNYAARIDKVEPRKGEKTGNPYWNFEFTITEPEQLVGRKLWDVFMLDVQSLWKIRGLAKAIGIDLSGERTLDSDEFLQQEVGIVVTHRQYEGQTQNNIKKYFSLTEETPEPAAPTGAPA